MEVKVYKMSITRVNADALVNPSNSFGYMRGGVAEKLKEVGGSEIEEEAIGHAPVEIGTALATTSGELKSKSVIHTPTMRDPASTTTSKIVKEAITAALELADEMDLKKIAVPGMGTGIGGVDKEEAASVMKEAIDEFDAKALQEIVLVDVDEDMVEAWKKFFA